MKKRNNRKSNNSRKDQVINLGNGKFRHIQHETKSRHDRRKLFASKMYGIAEIAPN